jgi:7,8-dihydropterin-6-yl-methyl-4-(beta-D-ribofuranosyl)aminobenzene 5'-phosphate synthase
MVPSDVTVGGSTLGFLRAEHGYSAMIDVVRGGHTRRVLYDTGVSPYGLVDNLDRLDVSPDTFESIVLSHGHFDHVAGMHGLIERMSGRDVPVILHPDFWTRRRIVTPQKTVELPTPSRKAIEGAGFRIVEDRQPSLLLDGTLLITGEVPRRTSFETGMPPGHQAWQDGDWQHDPWVREDQALIAHVRGRGLVIVTGCGHAGIVNIVRHVQRLTGEDQIAAIIGGFHLSGPMFEPIIEPTVAAFDELQPELLMPAHCTGWKAVHRLAHRFPDAFVQSAVGTTISL